MRSNAVDASLNGNPGLTRELSNALTRDSIRYMDPAHAIARRGESLWAATLQPFRASATYELKHCAAHGPGDIPQSRSRVQGEAMHGETPFGVALFGSFGHSDRLAHKSLGAGVLVKIANSKVNILRFFVGLHLPFGLAEKVAKRKRRRPSLGDAVFLWDRQRC
jgi:hypothetical protein